MQALISRQRRRSHPSKAKDTRQRGNQKKYGSGHRADAALSCYHRAGDEEVLTRHTEEYHELVRHCRGKVSEGKALSDHIGTKLAGLSLLGLMTRGSLDLSAVLSSCGGEV